jgi:sigma-B regulation protein RsbU (phosphoserine phosphatase)
MLFKRLPWQQELDIIDRTMKAISGIVDPEELVSAYWQGIGELLPIGDYVALSRRNETPPFYRVTRSSRFTEHVNPWTHRELLPRFSGGLLGEIVYCNQPVIIDDLPARLQKDDPAYFYLEGFASLVALPQYDGGEGLNVTIMLFPQGVEIDHAIIPLMHWQAGLFGRGTTNLVLRNQLSSALDALDQELEVVGNIQRSLLPVTLPKIPNFDVAAFYETSARAGGDYYDFFPLPHGEWGLFIADVSGHGTPAAVVMAITHALAHAQPGTHKPPVELLQYLNHQLASSYTRDGTFVTAFYAVLDPVNCKLSYARAGHNPPRLIRGDCVLPLDANNAIPLGIQDDEHYGQATITLQKGDLLLLYTDGITEAAAPMRAAGPREMFGIERLDKLLVSCRGCSAKDCIARIRAELGQFCEGAPQSDDQTLIAISCTGSGLK